MRKIRNFLLGVALALPLAALGSAGDVATAGFCPGKPAGGTSVVAGPQSQMGWCCVMYLGTWLCFPCTQG
ncbi:MAG: hypothetical protein LOD94_08395 [Gammaproteobacteria bacterium]|nr:hypothetical protein [Gammaproteobacteria bacterium]